MRVPRLRVLSELKSCLKKLDDEGDDNDYDVDLLDFSGGALEQLDVAVADALAMLGQRLVGRFVTGEQHESVTGGASVRLVHEQYSVFSVQHFHRRQTLLEELQLDKRQPTIHSINRSIQTRSLLSVNTELTPADVISWTQPRLCHRRGCATVISNGDRT